MATLLNTRHKMLMSAVILWSLEKIKNETILHKNQGNGMKNQLTGYLQIYQEH